MVDVVLLVSAHESADEVEESQSHFPRFSSAFHPLQAYSFHATSHGSKLAVEDVFGLPVALTGVIISCENIFGFLFTVYFFKPPVAIIGGLCSVYLNRRHSRDNSFSSSTIRNVDATGSERGLRGTDCSGVGSRAISVA